MRGHPDHLATKRSQPIIKALVKEQPSARIDSTTPASVMRARFNAGYEAHAVSDHRRRIRTHGDDVKESPRFSSARTGHVCRRLARTIRHQVAAPGDYHDGKAKMR
jgi:hypothetical protein